MAYKVISSFVFASTLLTAQDYMICAKGTDTSGGRPSKVQFGDAPVRMKVEMLVAAPYNIKSALDLAVLYTPQQGDSLEEVGFAILDQAGKTRFETLPGYQRCPRDDKAPEELYGLSKSAAARAAKYFVKGNTVVLRAKAKSGKTPKVQFVNRVTEQKRLARLPDYLKAPFPRIVAAPAQPQSQIQPVLVANFRRRIVVGQDSTSGRKDFHLPGCGVEARNRTLGCKSIIG